MRGQGRAQRGPAPKSKPIGEASAIGWALFAEPHRRIPPTVFTGRSAAFRG